MNKLSRFLAIAVAGVFCLLTATASFADHASFAETAEQARKCGIFSGSIDRVTAAVKDGAISEDDGNGLLVTLLEVCNGRLPLAPFEDKLAEGLAKRVAPPLIVRALQSKLDVYRFVRRLLSARFEIVDPELLVVMGEGVSQGASRIDMEAYVDEFSDRAASPFLNGAHMVSLLGQSGFDYGLTRSMLVEAFSAGGPAAEWRYLIRIVLVARKRGLSDGDIAEAARRTLAENGSLSDVSSRLGFTSRSMTGRTNSE